jgi:hypothetical protein
LDIGGRFISGYAADYLYNFICDHEKLIYLGLGGCDMDIDSLNTILDACQVTGKMQVMNLRRTIAASTAGKKSIEERIKSGNLCLLHIMFDPEDRTRAFMKRIRKYMGRHYKERKYLEKIQRSKDRNLKVSEKLEALSSIGNSPDGLQNLYKCLRENYGGTLTLFSVHAKRNR